MADKSECGQTVEINKNTIIILACTFCLHNVYAVCSFYRKSGKDFSSVDAFSGEALCNDSV